MTATTDEARDRFVARLAELTARLPHIPQAVQAEWLIGCAIAEFEETHNEATTLEWLRCVADEYQSRLQRRRDPDGHREKQSVVELGRTPSGPRPLRTQQLRMPPARS